MSIFLHITSNFHEYYNLFNINIGTFTQNTNFLLGFINEKCIKCVKIEKLTKINKNEEKIDMAEDIVKAIRSGDFDLANNILKKLRIIANGHTGEKKRIALQACTDIDNLIKSAIKRATICNSDPLCWGSDGQGLFDLNSNLGLFKSHLRDFLIQSKEFAKDDPDLFREELELEQQRKLDAQKPVKAISTN